jgi:hypothetical protein
MGMSEFYGARDDQESIATIHRTVGLGVTLLDMADMYGCGENECLVGRATAALGVKLKGNAAGVGLQNSPHKPHLAGERSFFRLPGHSNAAQVRLRKDTARFRAWSDP